MSPTQPAPRQPRAPLRFAPLVVLAALTVAACSGQNLKDPDDDNGRNKARPFARLDEVTEDTLNVDKGDLEDWRLVAPDRNAMVKLRISVGRWERSSIEGDITVFNEVGDRLAEERWPVGSGTVNLSFDGEAGMRYLLRFHADRGAGLYAVQIDFGEGCGDCADGEVCREGRCQEACQGGCAGDQECDEDRGKCVSKGSSRPKPSCTKECPAGERLNRRRCRCYRPRPPKRQGIKVTVIDARGAGSGSVLTLSAGANRDIKKGMKGSINGLSRSSFTIVEVYPARAKARCGLPPKDIYGHTQAVIRP
jgi:hypothetical protein